MMDRKQYEEARAYLMRDNCKHLIDLERSTTEMLLNAILSVASRIKDDFDNAADLKPYWVKYPPVQRGRKPRGDSFPWGEVGEKVIEGHLYSIAPNIFEGVKFLGLPFGHDVRFVTKDSLIHVDAKSTGPNDNLNEIVCSRNQVTGNGLIDEDLRVYNDPVEMRGSGCSEEFQPELAPFYILDNCILPTLTFFVKVVYSVKSLGEQPLEYLELICVPNGLALFDGARLCDKGSWPLTKGKDRKSVKRKRTRIQLQPLSNMDSWRCQKIKFSGNLPYVESRSK